METVWLAQQSAPATSLYISGFNLVPWLALTNVKLSLHSSKLLPFVAPFSYCLCPSWGCPKTNKRWIGLGVNCSEQTFASKQSVMRDHGLFLSALLGRTTPSTPVSDVLFSMNPHLLFPAMLCSWHFVCSGQWQVLWDRI